MRTSFKSLFCVSVAAIVLMCGSQAHATLLGTSMTGSLVFPGLNSDNYFDPVNGDAAPGYLNYIDNSTTVTISSTPTFGFATSSATISAVFTDTTLTVQEGFFLNGAVYGDAFTFTDTALGSLALNETSDTFTNGGLTGSIVGDTLTLNWAGDNVTTGEDLSATFSFASVGGVPEISGSTLSSGVVLVSGWLMLFLPRRRICNGKVC